MKKSDIIQIQERLKIDADGIWGPISDAACKSYLRGLMTSPNPWPASDDESMVRFYGKPGDESNLVSLSVAGMGVKYDGQPVGRIRCHKRVAESLGRILDRIANGPHRAILAQYAGCFSDRAMRGGSRPSKHSWGVAIDLDPDPNGLRVHWPRVATMPFEVMIEFAREGWTSAGAFWNRDAMHHEACRV